MLKHDEVERGCFAKAADNEPLFVLRGQDKLAPALVREWARLAAENGCPPDKVQEARNLADAMDRWLPRKYPD
ncbi:unnamed protein product [Phaeothamnion confervicola]